MVMAMVMKTNNNNLTSIIVGGGNREEQQIQTININNGKDNYDNNYNTFN